MVKIFKIKEIRDFGQLLSASFYYVRRYFNTLGKGILYFVVPLILLSAIIASQYIGQSYNAATNNMIQYYDMALGSVWSGLVAGLAMTALAAVVLNHMKLAADDQITEENIQVEVLWKGVKKDFFMILILNIGVFIATCIGFILFFIPGIFVSVKLTLVSAVYVFEDQDLGGAFSRSWNLITDHWWTTFGLVLVMGLFVWLMSMTISMPLVIISSFASFSGIENLGTIIGLFYGLINSLTYIFYTVIYVCLGLHYYNLVERKEGEGLEERIAMID